MLQIVQTIVFILIALAVLLLMIAIHEFGHYTAGKLLKFRINEFSIGFGPLLFQRKLRNGEQFSLRAIPLGGYCAFHDEEGTGGPTPTNIMLEATTSAPGVDTRQGRSFVEEAPWKRLIVFVSGALFNFVSAILFSFLFILAVGATMPQVGEVYVDPTGTAYNQLAQGDVIVAVDGRDIDVMNTFDDYAMEYQKGDSMVLTVRRNGSLVDITVQKQTIIDAKTGQEYVGIGFRRSTNIRERGNLASALIHCVPFTFKMAWLIIGALLSLLSFQTPVSEMSGPVGTVNLIAELTAISFDNLFLLLPLLAANLAIFNLLPFPALDGSKMVFTSIEWVRGRPINRNIESLIHFAGLVLLMGFVIAVDLINLIS